MIKVLIVEDEIPAQITLKKLIDKCCPDSRIVMTLTSVNSTVKWLEENPDGADVIFMDVELSDGICFEIFEKVKISANVIITTAYDNYVSGYMYHFKDVAGFFEGMRILKNNAVLRKTMGMSNQETVKAYCLDNTKNEVFEEIKDSVGC